MMYLHTTYKVHHSRVNHTHHTSPALFDSRKFHRVCSPRSLPNASYNHRSVIKSLRRPFVFVLSSSWISSSPIVFFFAAPRLTWRSTPKVDRKIFGKNYRAANLVLCCRVFISLQLILTKGVIPLFSPQQLVIEISEKKNTTSPLPCPRKRKN